MQNCYLILTMGISLECDTSIKSFKERVKNRIDNIRSFVYKNLDNIISGPYRTFKKCSS